jgi:WD repeat-containing protein 19
MTCISSVLKTGQEMHDMVMQIAHAKLLKAAQRLQSSRAFPPPLLSALATIHSYILVKHLVGVDDQLGAARLLQRVVANILLFRSHAARIMTSAVLQCLRAGLPQTAFDIATSLLRPEYRDQLQDMGATYRRKIEGVVCTKFCKQAGLLISCCHLEHGMA